MSNKKRKLVARMKTEREKLMNGAGVAKHGQRHWAKCPSLRSSKVQIIPPALVFQERTILGGGFR